MDPIVIDDPSSPPPALEIDLSRHLSEAVILSGPAFTSGDDDDVIFLGEKKAPARCEDDDVVFIGEKKAPVRCAEAVLSRFVSTGQLSPLRQPSTPCTPLTPLPPPDAPEPVSPRYSPHSPLVNHVPVNPKAEKANVSPRPRVSNKKPRPTVQRETLVDKDVASLLDGVHDRELRASASSFKARWNGLTILSYRIPPIFPERQDIVIVAYPIDPETGINTLPTEPAQEVRIYWIRNVDPEDVDARLQSLLVRCSDVGDLTTNDVMEQYLQLLVWRARALFFLRPTDQIWRQNYFPGDWLRDTKQQKLFSIYVSMFPPAAPKKKTKRNTKRKTGPKRKKSSK